jgi:hypothetical protein
MMLNMPVTYTNRKDRTYYLRMSTTKTGKTRYFFSPKAEGNLLDEIPEGYEITESVNGIVSLSKARPKLIKEEEIESVKHALKKHPKGKNYRVDVKSKVVTIYEAVGPDLEELAETLMAEFGLFTNEHTKRQLEELHKTHTQYTPIMKFTLKDEKKRLFQAQRMCYLGSVDDWIVIGNNVPIKEYARELIPKLSTDRFFDLF